MNQQACMALGSWMRIQRRHRKSEVCGLSSSLACANIDVAGKSTRNKELMV